MQAGIIDMQAEQSQLSKPDCYKSMEPIALAYFEARLEDGPHLLCWDFHVTYLQNLEDGYVYLHCLDLDIMAYGRDETSAEDKLLEMIFEQLMDYRQEKRLEYFMAYPAEQELLEYYHALKRRYYAEQGKLIDKYNANNRIEQLESLPIKEPGKIRDDKKTILVSRKDYWPLQTAA